MHVIYNIVPSESILGNTSEIITMFRRCQEQTAHSRSDMCRWVYNTPRNSTPFVLVGLAV